MSVMRVGTWVTALSHLIDVSMTTAAPSRIRRRWAIPYPEQNRNAMMRFDCRSSSDSKQGLPQLQVERAPVGSSIT
jgi:hypothetical protein